MIKLRDILNEVGEGTATPYKFKYMPLKGDSVRNKLRHAYRFITDSRLQYEVNVFKIIPRYTENTTLTVMFSVVGGKYEDITNKGEQYKIMATVIDIIKADIELLAKEGNPPVKMIEFTPEKADATDNRRAKFYKAYIQKQLPNAHVDSYNFGEYYRITL